MPKLKTRKTLLRRIKISRNGKVTKRKIGLKHLKVNKGVNQKQRNNSTGAFINKKIIGRFKKMLGKYGKNL
jgi:ribosomal protein L35